MSFDWNNLPIHLMENILSNFSHKQLKCLSLVSWNWLNIIDSYWSKNTYLVLDKMTENENSINECCRDFRNFSVLEENNFIVIQNIFEKMSLKNKIKRLESKYLKYDDLVQMVKLSGNSLESLSVNLFPPKHFYEPHKIDELRKVRVLIIEYESLPKVSLFYSNFKNLHRLEINIRLVKDFEAIQSLLKSNKNTLREIHFESPSSKADEFHSMIEDLNLEKATFKDTTKKFLNSIFTIKTLKYLELEYSQFTDEDVVNIQTSFPKLRELKLKVRIEDKYFTEKGFQKLWEIPYLKTLYMGKVIFEKISLQKNSSLTVLELCKVTIDEEQVEKIVKSSPNLKTLKFVKLPLILKLSTLQKISNQLKCLESFISKEVRWSCEEIDKHKEILFENLKYFKIMHNFEDINQILKVLKFPKLGKVKFSQCCHLSNTGLEYFFANHQKIAMLKIKLAHSIAKFDLKPFLMLRDLETVHSDLCQFEEALLFLKECRQDLIVYIKLSFYSSVKEDIEGFLDDVQLIWRQDLKTDKLKSEGRIRIYQMTNDHVDLIFWFIDNNFEKIHHPLEW
ncbi:hypothetical protein ACFFRR_004809 [Megaselia abdita]